MKKLVSFISLIMISLFHSQLVSAKVDTEGYYGWTRLVNNALAKEHGPARGQCVDVHAESKQSGASIGMWPCHNGSNQKFRLKDLSFNSSRIAVYSDSEELCLDYLRVKPMRIFTTSCESAPKWRVESTGEIATDDLKLCMSTSEEGGLEMVENCNPFNLSFKSRFGSNWYIHTLPDIDVLGREVSLVNLEYVNCLDVGRESKNPGSALVHYRCYGGDNQMWTLRGSTDEMFITVYQGKDMLCLSNLNGAAGSTLDATEAVPCDRSDARQLWHIPSGQLSNGMPLVNHASGKCLDAYSIGLVGSWACHGGNNQSWGLLQL
ncbi:ricin-type beta-trefoil lectin domain protein [Microbulbifer pacificus]|uniref:ricin-type beta-trefoil lectin domain protein n=1 Tax=Microbulbifer pacificus TaxID=407164 RepID=UPI001319E16A|nr:ricin-type beta-trefoil lectin domain protein [Microbulbifer pacificus]